MTDLVDLLKDIHARVGDERFMEMWEESRRGVLARCEEIETPHGTLLVLKRGEEKSNLRRLAELFAREDSPEIMHMHIRRLIKCVHKEDLDLFWKQGRIVMPAKSEKQRKFMAAELARKRKGKKTKTKMTAKQLRDFAKKKK